MDRKEFVNPGPQYRGVTLWMLNDRLEPDEIERQLRGFRDAGWGAVITRTFVGLRTEYLSEEWMAILARINRVAREIGLKVWFQAGYMPSGIPDLPRGMMHRALVARKKGEKPVDGDRTLAGDAEYEYCQRTLDHVLDLLSPDAVRFYLKRAYDDTWIARFAKDFGDVVEAVWVDEPHFQPPKLPWSERLPQVFEKTWGYSILDRIPSLFRRSGDFLKVRHHYWRTVVRMLMDAYFVEVGDWCEKHGVRFSGHLMGEDSLLSQAAWTGAAMPLYEHMQLPGIDHLTLSLTWWHGRSGGIGGEKFIMTPKQCSSVAAQTGRREVLAEMYGVSTQGLSFEDRKQIGEWFALLGINYRCYHGSFYSMRGRRKRIYAPHLAYQQPWWPDNRIEADRFARLSWALRQGTFRADALVVHPIESASSVFEPLGFVPYQYENCAREMAEMNAAFAGLSENLMRAHVSFQYGDEGMLARLGRVKGRSLVLGRMSYRTVLLPSTITLRRSTMELLRKFRAAGGEVFLAGDPPSRVDGCEDAKIGALLAGIRRVRNEPRALAAAVKKAVPPEVEIRARDGAGDVWLHEREMNGSRLIFVANTSRTRAVAAEVRVRGKGRLSEWDLDTGSVRPIPQKRDGAFAVAKLDFAPVGSRLIGMESGGRAKGVSAALRGKARTEAVAREFRVKRRSPNVLTLDFARLRKGNGAWIGPLPVIGIQQMLTEEEGGYEGPVTLEYRFEAEVRPERICAVVEDADACDIRVNGRQVRYAGLPYYVDRSFLPVDIAAFVREGENAIEVRRDFKPLRRPKFSLSSLFENIPGVELEPIYLTGDFGVKGKLSKGEKRPKCVRMSHGFAVTTEAAVTRGDLVADGYPFFAGKLSLLASARLASPREGERVFLSVPALHSCLAAVRVDGKKAGTIAWPPYEVEITGLARGGVAEIEIELTNTLRNLHGPHHRPLGEPDSCWGENDYSGRWSAKTRQGYPKWYARRAKETEAWTDDYFFLQFGLKGPIVARYVR